MSALSKVTKSVNYFERHRHQVLNKILRVDHAGELGADRIYHGQIFVLSQDPKHGPVIQHMWDQEKAHLEEMEYLHLKYRTRKSLLEPMWSFGGFLLGSASALLGPKAAMACTMAVEKTITKHYNDQIRDIIAEDDLEKSKYLLDKLSRFRDDEQQHHDTAEEYDGKDESRLFNSIETICRISIKIAERV